MHGLKNSRRRTSTRWAMAMFAGVATISGCEVGDYLNPAEAVKTVPNTPIQIPILTRLAAIEDAGAEGQTISQVQPSDLIPTQAEYTIGVGDYLDIQVFELLYPGQYSAFQEKVNETGAIRLPIVGTIQAAGLTATQVEQRIVDVLAEKQILFDALVSASVAGSQQNTYTVIGEPLQGTTRFGVYNIPRPDFRLLEAIALAGGIDGRSKTLLVIRQTPLNDDVAGQTDIEQPSDGGDADLNDLLGDSVDEPASGQVTGAAAQALTDAVGQGGAEWVYVNGEWQRVGDGGLRVDASAGGSTDELSQYISQRIISIPYQKLVNGDLRYNIVVRPGDTIRVPDPSAGFVYIGGNISRPGAYTVSGENELTITQLVTSAGGFSATAIPERTVIRRRIGDEHEAILRLNLRAIQEGSAPNIFLKPNDEITIGTNFWATPLAVVRNGFRMTYGFGFLADRNFGNDLFGAPPRDN